MISNPFRKSLIIYRFQIILGLLFLFTVGSLFSFLFCQVDSKIGIIAGGITTGLIVAIIQYMFSLQEYQYYSEIKKLDINKILTTRDEETFYNRLIDKSANRIWVMGVTANRMMDDFANESSPRSDKKVLLLALARGIEVRILLPQKQFLSEKDKIKFDNSALIFEKIKKRFTNFKVRYFKHIPSQSIFVVDDQSILGPVFSNYASKDTPCIHMGVNNDFAKKYLEYYESEWESSNG